MIVAVRAIPACFDVEQRYLAVPAEVLEVHFQCYEPLLQHPIRTDVGGHRSAQITTEMPALAASWDATRDGRTCSFQLRKGVRSAAGNELTAHDVKWSWERAFALGAWGARLAAHGGVCSPEALRVAGTYTIQFRLDEPQPHLPALLASPFPPVFDIEAVHRHCSEEDVWGERWLRHHTAGFGPYELESVMGDQEASLVANAYYWQGPPADKRVLLRAVPQAGQRAEALLRGSVDLAADLPAGEAARVGRSAAIKVSGFAGPRAILLRLDPQFPPFDQARIQRALALALPYADIAQQACGDPRSRPAGAQQDMREARGLLREAGYGSGFRIGLAVPQDNEELMAAAKLIQLEVMKLSLKAVIEPMSPLVFEREKAGRHLPGYLEERLCLSPLVPADQLEPLPEVRTIVLAQPPQHLCARSSVQGFVRRADGRPRYVELRKA